MTSFYIDRYLPKDPFKFANKNGLEVEIPYAKPIHPNNLNFTKEEKINLESHFEELIYFLEVYTFEEFEEEYNGFCAKEIEIDRFNKFFSYYRSYQFLKKENSELIFRVEDYPENISDEFGNLCSEIYSEISISVKDLEKYIIVTTFDNSFNLVLEYLKDLIELGKLAFLVDYLNIILPKVSRILEIILLRMPIFDSCLKEIEFHLNSFRKITFFYYSNINTTKFPLLNDLYFFNIENNLKNLKKLKGFDNNQESGFLIPQEKINLLFKKLALHNCLKDNEKTFQIFQSILEFKYSGESEIVWGSSDYVFVAFIVELFNGPNNVYKSKNNTSNINWFELTLKIENLNNYYNQLSSARSKSYTKDKMEFFRELILSVLVDS